MGRSGAPSSTTALVVRKTQSKPASPKSPLVETDTGVPRFHLGIEIDKSFLPDFPAKVGAGKRSQDWYRLSMNMRMSVNRIWDLATSTFPSLASCATMAFAMPPLSASVLRGSTCTACRPPPPFSASATPLVRRVPPPPPHQHPHSFAGSRLPLRISTPTHSPPSVLSQRKRTHHH